MTKTLRVLKNLKTIVMAVAFIVTGGSVWAYDFVEDGIYYNITDAVNNYVEVTYSTTSYSTYADLDVVVPSTVTHDAVTYTVTGVGDHAFQRGSTPFAHGVKTVELPATITTIGTYAFANNGTAMGGSYLTSVNIPAAVTTIGTYAFQNCTNLTTIALPDALTSIGDYAFNGCSGITSITIPANVTTLGSSNVFVGCTGLTSVTYNATNMTSPGSNSIWSATTNPCTLTIGAGVTQIPNNVFKGLLSNVTTIYFNATNCADFTSSNYSSKWTSLSSSCSVIFGNGVTRIPNYLFYQKVLANLTFGNALESIGDYAFGGPSGPASFNSLSGITVTIPSTLTSVGQYAFYKCQCDFSQIPSGVTTIGQYAFYNCVNMTCAVDLSNVTTIPTYAFYGTAIPSVVIGQGTTTIGANAFTGCTAITNVTYNAANLTSPGSNTIWGTPTNPCTLTIGPNVTTIPAYAFKGLSNVTAVNFNATSFNDYTSNSNVWPTFASCAVIFGDGVTRIPNYLFNNCTQIASVSIGTAVTSIGTYAFYGCSGINTAVVIPNSVTTIGNSAFYGCTNMTGITIGTGVASIGTYAFRNCSSLASVVFNITSDSYTMPSSSYAFSGCSHECTLTIGAGVRRIPNYTFNGLSNITAINFNATNCVDNTDTTGDLLYSSIWSGKSVSCTLTFGAGVTNVPAFLFKGYTGLTSVSINNGVTAIGQYAFDGCTGIVSCNIPSSLTSIGTFAFNGCSNLESAIVIPSGVSVIPASTFKGCAKISSVNIHDGVTTLGDYAFQNCTGMTSLTIGTGVNSFGTNVFKGDNGLTSIVFNATLSGTPTVPASTTNAIFNGCNSVTHGCTFTLGAGVTQIPNYLLSGLTKLDTINYNATSMGDFTSGNYTNVWYSRTSSPCVLIIGAGVTKVPNYLFKGYTGLVSVTIGDDVVNIGEYAFDGCTGITTVALPNTLTTISQYAFNGCTAMASCNMPTSMTTIGQNAFYNCSSLASAINIPSGVTTIPTNVFYGCASIPSVVISDNVTSIGASAFQGCTGMTNLTIGEGVASIGTYAFRYCTSLASVVFNIISDSYTMPTSNTSFSGCSHACTLTIGAGVRRIPNYTFNGLSNITAINFNATNCADNTGSSGDMYHYYIWSGRSVNCTLTIGTNVTHIPAYLFKDYTGITDFTMGTGVTTIGQYAFYGCTNLTGDIVIPDAVTTIPDYAFYNCSSITSITLGSGVTSLGVSALQGCSGMTTFAIGEDFQTIGSNALTGCTGLTSVTFNAANMADLASGTYWGTPTSPCTLTIGPNVTRIPAYVFKGLLGNVTRIDFNATGCCDYTSSNYSNVWPNLSSSCDVVFGNGVTHVPDYLFYSKALASVTFGNALESIGEYAFAGSSASFTSMNGFTITLPATLTTIEQDAFKYCKADFTAIPGTITSIGQEAFHSCSNISCTADLSGLTTIPTYIFYNCTSLPEVIIGENTTTIEKLAFYGCTGITSVTYNATNMTAPSLGSDNIWGAPTNPCTITVGPNVTQIPAYVFKGLNNVGTINFNATRCCDYTSGTISSVWPTLVSCNVNIGSGVTKVPDYLFSGKSAVDTICIGNDVDTIGNYAFNGNSNAALLTMGNSVVCIGEYAFKGCSSFPSVTLPTTLKTIGQYSFQNCTSLTELAIPDSVTVIPQYAFSGCSGLTSLTIGDNVTNIATYAFQSCTALASLTIGTGVETFGTKAFTGCTGLNTITFNAVNVTSVPTTSNSYVFYNCATTNPIELNIGTDVTAIPNYMFKGITKIGTINFNATQCADNTALNYSYIWDSKTTSDVNTVLNIGDNVKHIPAHLFRAYNNLTEINMGEEVESIGDYAFYVSSSGSSRLAGTTITLPSTLSSVGEKAFYYCLADFVWSESITTLGTNAFYGCSNMSCPVVLDNVTSIPASTFGYCSSVPSIVIGKNVSNIGTKAFESCTGLKEVWAKPATPVTLYSGTNATFKSVTVGNITLYYPKGSSYPTATVWKDFSPLNAFYGFYTDGDWNVASKWTGNTVPDNTSLVLIEAEATIPSGCVAEADSLIMTNGSIIIADGGQLVYDHDGITATVQKNIASALGKDESEHWYAIASPIGAVAIDTNLVSGLYDLYRYDEPTMVWENYKAHDDFDTLENGRGYLYRNAANRTLAFNGELSTASVDYELTVSYHALPGFHLIGNPFAHNISKGSAKAIDDDNLNTGFYTLTNNGAWQPQVDGTGVIAPCSATLVQANAEGTLTINKVYTASSAKGGADHDYLMFRVANSTYEDVAYAWFDDAVGLNKIEHRNANIPMLYINNADGDYAIATMGEGTKSFNLSFKTSTMGKYTLTANANGQFNYLHIFDRLTGADVDMLINNEYTFVGSSTDIESRFIVRLSNDATIDDEVFAYQIGSDLVVSGNGELQVFDVAGRLVSRQQINGIETWNASSVQTGVYILRLVGNDVKTQKIVIR